MSMNSLDAGKILDSGKTKYRITDILGQGGFGITYLAMGEIQYGNVTTEGKFAIKEHFPSDFCEREGDRVKVKPGKEEDFARSKEDFIAEAKKLHNLGTENDNIVKVNEIFEANGTAYYIMQYINGKSLQSYEGKPLPFNEAVKLLLPVFDAVDFLHKSRINHFDIKPDNIMLHESGGGRVTPVLIDFGLSVHFKKNGSKTSPKGVMGVSEGYSPLEQYAGVKEFNPATDIYALAATLFFAVTGRKPLGAADIKLQDVRKALAGKVPSEAIEGICKAMAKSDEDRTSSVSLFKSDIGASAESGNKTQVIDGKKDSDGDDVQKRKKWILWGAIALVAVACAIVLPLTIGRDKKEKVEPTPPVEELTNQDSAAQSEAVAGEETEPGTKPEPAPAPEPKPEPAPEPKPTPAPEPKPTNNTNTGSGSQGQTPQPAKPEKPAVTTGTLSLGYGTWVGGVRDGKPDGKGTLKFTSSHKLDDKHTANPGDRFEGYYRNGKIDNGFLFDNNGNKTPIMP